jgi:uncharacterized membrane protein HdeD (DUF308 family)
MVIGMSFGITRPVCYAVPAASPVPILHSRRAASPLGCQREVEMPVNSALGSTLRHVVAKHWWILLMRGLASIAFGILAFVWPGLTLASLILLYGIYCLADGFVALTGGFGNAFWQSLFVGAISIGAGIATFMYPGLTALVLLYLIAFWAVVRGVSEIAVAIEFRKVIEGEWLMIVAGAMSIAFGVLLFLFPGAGALSLIWIIAVYALAFGAVLVALSFRVKSFAL